MCIRDRGKNQSGQLGNGTTNNSLVPVKIMDNITAISGNESFRVAIKNDGSLWSWGYNEAGQLGDGTTNYSLVPVKVMDNISAIFTGDENVFAIKDDDSLYAWGYNGINGLLGDGTDIDRYSPCLLYTSMQFKPKNITTAHEILSLLELSRFTNYIPVHRKCADNMEICITKKGNGKFRLIKIE